MIDFVELISILASIFELSGLYLLSKKNRIGFVLNIIAGLSWISYSLISHNAIGLLLVCSVALIINFNGFTNWRKK